MHVSLVPNKSIIPGRQDYNLLECNYVCLLAVYQFEVGQPAASIFKVV